jgi:hypothetical protein
MMFTHPLTPNDEYWCGYFRADGCIVRRDVTKFADFGQARFHPVNEFASHIGRPGKVLSGARNSGFAFHIKHVVTSAAAAYLLDDLGVKSDLWPGLYTSRHFWRGMVDGDGSIFFHKIKSKTPGLWSPGLSLIASRKDSLEYHAFIKERLEGFEPYLQPSVSSDMYYTKLCGNRAKAVVHLLYDDAYTANVKKYVRVRQVLDKEWTTNGRAWRPTQTW